MVRVLSLSRQPKMGEMFFARDGRLARLSPVEAPSSLSFIAGGHD